ncbi:hypothetical protein Barb6_00760 [Bacteroidales bacterium Barb6]|nr:hypothetical protein Barb6_00760 [Bacteroidales bacterium Barb6]
MKRQVQQLGVRHRAGDGLVSLQAEAFKVLDNLFSQFGSIIPAECEVTGNDISPGLVELFGADPNGNPTCKAVPFAGRVDNENVFLVFFDSLLYNRA